MKRWPRVTCPATMPLTSKRTTSGSSVSMPKVATIECSGRTHCSAPGLAERSPQRIALGHGKVRTITGKMSASTSIAGLPGFSISAM